MDYRSKLSIWIAGQTPSVLRLFPSKGVNDRGHSAFGKPLPVHIPGAGLDLGKVLMAGDLDGEPGELVGRDLAVVPLLASTVPDMLEVLSAGAALPRFRCSTSSRICRR
jgi:hypothetical protein